MNSYQNGEKVFTRNGGNLVGGIWGDLNNRRKYENVCGVGREGGSRAGDRLRARSCRGKEGGGGEGGEGEGVGGYDWEYSEFERLAEENDYQIFDKDCNFIITGKGKG